MGELYLELGRPLLPAVNLVRPEIIAYVDSILNIFVMIPILPGSEFGSGIAKRLKSDSGSRTRVGIVTAL